MFLMLIPWTVRLTIAAPPAAVRLQYPHGRDEDDMNAHFRRAVAAIRRLRREPMLIERRRYPPKHELWTQERGVGPRPADWPGIFEELN